MIRACGYQSRAQSSTGGGAGPSGPYHVLCTSDKPWSLSRTSESLYPQFAGLLWQDIAEGSLLKGAARPLMRTSR